jgi:hypothetical protein
MPTLRAPDGKTYTTEDEAEIRNLTLGHGYAIVPDEQSTEDTPSAPGEPTEEETTPTDG